jgi:hypothetical protein
LVVRWFARNQLLQTRSLSPCCLFLHNLLALSLYLLPRTLPTLSRSLPPPYHSRDLPESARSCCSCRRCHLSRPARCGLETHEGARAARTLSKYFCSSTCRGRSDSSRSFFPFFPWEYATSKRGPISFARDFNSPSFLEPPSTVKYVTLCNGRTYCLIALRSHFRWAIDSIDIGFCYMRSMGPLESQWHRLRCSSL